MSEENIDPGCINDRKKGESDQGPIPFATPIGVYLYTCIQLQSGKDRSDLGFVSLREYGVDAFRQESLYRGSLLGSNDFEGSLNFGGKMPPYQHATKTRRWGRCFRDRLSWWCRWGNPGRSLSLKRLR